ncbi:MAG: hypothetical protein QOJ90_2412 [Actinomycetota bacterium]|jgi:hypothetical protein|nr:hypothetical protein [Actinomycetota bacterium]
MVQLPAQRRRAQEFAELLEGRRDVVGHELEPLVRVAATLRPAPLEPASDFRSELRARLVAETERAVAPLVVPQPRTGGTATARPPRMRQAVAALVATTLVGGVGVAAASTRAVPGDALYGLKRGIESAELSLARSDMSRGRELLEQADHRLSEAEALAASGSADEATTRGHIRAALEDLDTTLRAGADALNRSYRDTGDAAALTVLDGVVTGQRQRVDALIARLARLDPPATGLRDQAEEIAALLDSLHADAARTAELATAAAETPVQLAQPAAPARDGWEVSRVAGWIVSGAAGTSATSPSGGGVSSVASGATSSSGSGGLVGSVVGPVTSGSTAPTASGVTVPSVAVPVPTVSALPVPIPTAAVVPTKIAVPTTTGGLPCVPIPGITSC